MSKYDLSILIPSRNEMFLKNTIEDILKNKRGNTEIIIGLDGLWADPVIPQHPDVSIIYYPESIGQRAISNRCARISNAKYIMKCDAHCSFAEGFDTTLMENMEDNWTVVPTMRNLWAFDWKCKKCGLRTYQGPTLTKCTNCGCEDKDNFIRKMVWVAKRRPQSSSYCFDSTPHFQYFNEYTKRSEYKEQLEKTGVTETMSLQGSCFMLTKEKWFELNICDERWGSWGSQGIEVSFRTWASGGKVITNHHTHYGHMFRTQGGDFGFPYHLSSKQTEFAKKNARELIFKKDLPNQEHDLVWLLEKFWPVPGWTEEDLNNLKMEDNKFKEIKNAC
jgi:hypothetical protein